MTTCIRVTSILGVLLAAAAPLNGQTGFEDTKGRSSIVLRRGGAAKFNSADSRLTIGYAHAPDGNAAGISRWGAEVSAKASEGVAALFDGSEIGPEITGKVYLGWQGLLAPTAGIADTTAIVVDDWIGIELGYTRASHILVRDISTADVDTSGFDGGVARAYYNLLPSSFNGVIGFAAGLRRDSNYGLLRKTEYRQEVSTESGDTTRIVSTTVTGRSGEVESEWAPSAAIDVVWLPTALGGEIGVNFFGRYEGHSYVEEQFEPGIALVITKPGAPTITLGAISVVFGQETKVGLVAGFSF